MAARFDPEEAADRGQTVGDGTPIHLTIPTPAPWVPLRILTLGVGDRSVVEADVFLLTEGVPEMLPQPVVGTDEGMILDRSEQASKFLLRDLRSDKGMKWLPRDDMWFSYLRINAKAGDLKHDLAIDPSGYKHPSVVAAGLAAPPAPVPLPDPNDPAYLWVIAGLAAAGTLVWWRRRAWSA
jgi:hypothetical protein